MSHQEATTLPSHMAEEMPGLHTASQGVSGQAAPMTRASSAAHAVEGRFTPFKAWWRAIAPRERNLVLLAALVLGSFLLYTLLIRPAWNVVRDAPAKMASLDAQLQHMQAQAGESQELRGTPRMAPQQAAVALKAATDALGSAAKLNVLGDRATIVFTNISGEALRRWMIEARSAARVRATEASLTRNPAGTYNGQVVVALPAP